MVKPEKFGHLHLAYHFTVPLSYLNEYRYNHNFQNCTYSLEVESTA